MNRKQKIILYSVLIFLVILLLLGFTYGYFMTKIIGNDNKKSISVTSGTLELTYGENTSEILGDTKIEPGYSVTKTFSATNTGNRDVIYGAVLENIENSFTRQEDIVYTLICKSYKKGTTTISGTCDGKDETQFPATGDVSLMITNTIPVGITHSYELTITYKNLKIDQSIDMGNKFSARVNIRDLDTLNPYTSNTNTLKYNIINNAIKTSTSSEANGTAIYRSSPSNTTTEASLIPMKDDDGLSYYFRGNVKNNYVNFANMCWRIVRIEGNGSIRLIINDYHGTCQNVGEDWHYPNDYGSDNYLTVTKNKLNSAKSKYLKSGYCFGDEIKSGTEKTFTDSSGFSTTYGDYTAYNRISVDKKPTLICKGHIINDDIKVLTADEVMLAMGNVNRNYLAQEYNSSNLDWRTATYSHHYNYFDYYYVVVDNGSQFSLEQGATNWSGSGEDSLERITISLTSEVLINNSGEGTKTNPYVIQ